MMKITSKNVAFLIYGLAVAGMMSGCGSEDVVVDIVDHIETNKQAEISYINMTQDPVVFHTKSTVYPNSVFDNDHKVIEVMSSNVSSEITHEWIDGAKETQFAMQAGYSSANRASTTTDLTNNESYWSIAWEYGQNFEILAIEKNAANQANKFVVRIFTNAELDVSLNQQNTNIPATEIGVISEAFSVDVCSDLSVGGHPIDLCQSANYGSAYLVVLDNQTGNHVIAQE